MRLISSGSGGIDFSGGYVNLTTVPKPTVDSALYRLQVRLSGMGAGASIILRQTVSGHEYHSPAVAADEDTAINYDIAIPSTGADIALAMWDADNSDSGAIVWTLYRIDEDQLPQTPGYLVPKQSTSVPLVFRVARSNPLILPTVKLQKNAAGGFNNAAGSVSSLGSGWFALTPTSADTSTEGPLLLEATVGSGAGAVKAYALYQVFSDTTIDDLAAAVEAKLLDDFAALHDLIAAGAQVPGGAIAYTIQFTDGDGGPPLDNVRVALTTDAAGTNVVDGWKLTNADGEATFNLDSGVTYHLWSERGGKKSKTGEVTVPVP